MWRLRTKSGIVATVLLIAIVAATLKFCSSDAPSPSAAPLAAAKPMPATLPAPAQPTPARKAANETDRVILSLFDSTLDKSGLAFEQQLRERYRNAYVGIYLLKGCNVEVESYNQKLAQGLAGEWKKQGKPTPPTQDISTMLTAIMEEARTSYSLLYIDTPCEKRNLPAFTEYFEKLGT